MRVHVCTHAPGHTRSPFSVQALVAAARELGLLRAALCLPYSFCRHGGLDPFSEVQFVSTEGVKSIARSWEVQKAKTAWQEIPGSRRPGGPETPAEADRVVEPRGDAEPAEWLGGPERKDLVSLRGVGARGRGALRQEQHRRGERGSRTGLGGEAGLL